MHAEDDDDEVSAWIGFNPLGHGHGLQSTAEETWMVVKKQSQCGYEWKVLGMIMIMTWLSPAFSFRAQDIRTVLGILCVSFFFFTTKTRLAFV
jgi:hypothetical protein